MGVNIWYIYLLSLTQIIFAFFVIVSIYYQPLKYENLNIIGCIVIHSIWSIQQTLISIQSLADDADKYQTSYFKGEKRESLGYALGVLSYLMIQNTSNLYVKCLLLAYNFILFCAFNNATLYNIQYIIAIFFCGCFNLYCDEQGREQLIREAEWMFELKNVIPNSLLVVQFDRKKKDIDLHMSNEKARQLFNLNGTTLNFINFCQHVTLQKKIKEEVNDTLFYLEQSNHKSNKSGIGFANSLHESRAQNSQYKQKEIQLQKKTNLYQFLIQRFQQLDDELLQKEILRQSSLQSNDKKSTKTNIAAAQANNQNNNITEFTNKIGGQQASKSIFGQSKTLINMMTSQKSQRRMMMPHHPSVRNRDSKKFEEYKCIYHRNSQMANQQQSPQLMNQRSSHKYIDEDMNDVKFTMKISIYVCIDDYFIVMSLDDSNISEKFQNQARLSFFYEEFCKQSLLKSTDQVVQLVQEIKQIAKSSQIVTEQDVSRFINSNLYLAESGLSNNLKPTTSNQNIAQTTQTTQNTVGGNVVNGSHLTNPTSNSQKGVYCISKRQLDNTLQSGILATTVISNFVNYFALRHKKRTQIDEKPFSIIRLIRNVQRIFQKQIDSKSIQVLINSQESHQSNPNSNVNVNSNLNNHISPDIRVFVNNNYQANSNNHNTSIININNLNNNSQMNNNLNSSNLQQNMSFSNVSTSVINHLSNSKDNFNNQANSNNNNNINNNQSNNISIRDIGSQQHAHQPNTFTNQLIAYQMNQKQLCDEITNDEAKLQHLIFNLFQNAVENTPIYGTIAFLIQRDQQLDNCIKICIRNKCIQNFSFPFLELEAEAINLGWKQMIQEFDLNGKFFFGIRMAAKLSQLIGPYNSLKFKEINNSELQAEFLIYDYSYEKGIYNQNSSSYKSYESSSYLASEKMSSEIKPKRKSTRQRCNSVSSYRVRLDSMDSFDKWIKMQNLEQQKGSNTLRIRNQLKYKN